VATETWTISELSKAVPWSVPASVSSSRQRIDLAGVLIDRVDLRAAVERIGAFLASETPHQIVTVNLDFLSLAQREAHFRETINQADLVVADGMPLVWVSRLKGERLAERITGVELVDQSCQLAARNEQGVFLLGAAPGVADTAGRNLEARYPGLRVVGTYSPAFDQRHHDEDERIVDLIQTARPDILLVALGAPRQDLWIQSHLDRLNVRLAMGIGCSWTFSRAGSAAPRGGCSGLVSSGRIASCKSRIGSGVVMSWTTCRCSAGSCWTVCERVWRRPRRFPSRLRS